MSQDTTNDGKEKAAAAPSQCPSCGARALRLTKKPRTVRHRGQSLEVEIEGYECERCGEVAYNPDQARAREEAIAAAALEAVASGQQVTMQRRLYALVGYVLSRFQRLPCTAATPEDRELVRASHALMRTALVQAQAVGALGDTKVAEAAAVNLRALFEVCVELRYLLLGGRKKGETPARRAQQMYVYAWMELEEAVRSSAIMDAEDRATAQSQLDVARTRYPDIHQELERLRQADPYKRLPIHWSGESTRGKIITQVGANFPGGAAQLRQAYKSLSWETHSVMGHIRDVLEEEGPEGTVRLRFRHFMEQDQAAEVNAGLALSMLGDAWTVFANAFNLPVRPSNEKSAERQAGAREQAPHAVATAAKAPGRRRRSRPNRS